MVPQYLLLSLVLLQFCPAPIILVTLVVTPRALVLVVFEAVPRHHAESSIPIRTSLGQLQIVLLKEMFTLKCCGSTNLPLKQLTWSMDRVTVEECLRSRTSLERMATLVSLMNHS